MALLSSRRVRSKRFEYEPRFYDPSRDERLKRRMRIKSKARPRGKQQGLLTLGILFILVLIIYLNF